MAEQCVKVGLVGCGAVARERHLPALKAVGKAVEVSAVCDISLDVARAIAKKFGVPKAYSSLEQMLMEEELDVVDVCTPPATHVAVASLAMERGCHVLLEKPMALSVDDCDAMIDQSKACGVKLGVIHNNTFHAGYTRLRALADAGAVGLVNGLRIYWNTPPNEMLAHRDHWAHRLPGGLIGETMPHLVYLTLPFTGKIKSVAVNGWKVTDYPWAPFDNYHVTLEAEKCLAFFTLSYSNVSNIVWIDALGTDGVLHLDFLNRVVTRHRCHGLTLPSVLSSSLSEIRQKTTGLVSSIWSGVIGRDRSGHGHAQAIRAFVKSIHEDAPLLVTGEDGRETVRVVNEIANQVEEQAQIRRVNGRCVGQK